jgi:multicomponent Na+:H+ antiporter subunit B
MESTVINVLLVLMAAAVVVLVRTRQLFAVVVLFGIYSFLMATVMVALDAVDVAMTEAAVGAGISTVLLLAALSLCRSEEASGRQPTWLPLALACTCGLLLVYGTFGLPAFSDPEAAVHTHVARRYIELGQMETGVPNIVTAVLASYRGFDTLGEVIVIFTAGAGIIALLRRRRAEGGGR